MFSKIGKIKATITNAMIADARFKAQQGEVNGKGEPVIVFFDVVLYLEDAEGNTTDWHGEVSNRTGFGKNANNYRYDITVSNLQSVGLPISGVNDFEPFMASGEPIGMFIGKQVIAVTDSKTISTDDGQQKEIVYVKYINPVGDIAPLRDECKDAFYKFFRCAPQNGQAEQPAVAPKTVLKQQQQQVSRQQFGNARFNGNNGGFGNSEPPF